MAHEAPVADHCPRIIYTLKEASINEAFLCLYIVCLYIYMLRYDYTMRGHVWVGAVDSVSECKVKTANLKGVTSSYVRIRSKRCPPRYFPCRSIVTTTQLCFGMCFLGSVQKLDSPVRHMMTCTPMIMSFPFLNEFDSLSEPCSNHRTMGMLSFNLSIYISPIPQPSFDITLCYRSTLKCLHVKRLYEPSDLSECMGVYPVVCRSGGLGGSSSSIQMNGGIMQELTTSRNYVNGSVATQQGSSCRNINKNCTNGQMLTMIEYDEIQPRGGRRDYMRTHEGRRNPSPLP